MRKVCFSIKWKLLFKMLKGVSIQLVKIIIKRQDLGTSYTVTDLGTTDKIVPLRASITKKVPIKPITTHNLNNTKQFKKQSAIYRNLRTDTYPRFTSQQTSMNNSNRKPLLLSQYVFYSLKSNNTDKTKHLFYTPNRFDALSVNNEIPVIVTTGHRRSII